MTDLPPPRKPYLMDRDEDAGFDPGLAPPVPEADPTGAAMLAAAQVGSVRGGGPGRFAIWAFGSAFVFVLSVNAWDFVTGLLERNSILGGIALVLLSAAALTALGLALREWQAFLRLARLDHLRARAETARIEADLGAARSVVASLDSLYRGRADQEWGRHRLAERRDDILDADGLLALAEAELLGPLDQRARREIEAAVRQVATVTALVPLALADVATALYSNLRMVRRIAEIYGGRSGSFGSLRLLRRVFSYLIATGALAVGDDLIGSVAGGGLLSKVSRRFGEGVINGALTARVGIAAMDLCRPMGFHAAPRPKVSNLVSRALGGLFDRAG